MTSDYIRRYYILKIISNPYNYGIDAEEYVSLENLQNTLSFIQAQNIDNQLFNKLDVFSEKNIKRDLDKILIFTGVDIGRKRHHGYYIKSVDEHQADARKDLYEKTELFLLNLKKDEWKPYVSTQHTSLDGRFDFAQIIYAIENQLQIHILFNGWYDNNQFENIHINIQPLHLKEAHKHWHLIGYHPKLGVYSFSLDERIDEFIITNKKVQDPISFNADEYFKNSIGILKDDTPVEKVVLKVANHHFKYLMIRKMHHSQKLIEAPKLLNSEKLDYNNPDMWGTIELKLQPNYEFLMEVFKYNRWIKVVSPAHIALNIKKHLKDMLAYY